jgi:acyl carrier protein
MDPILTRIRAALLKHGRLSVDALTVAPDVNLYEVGLTSHCSVNVMLALEADFDIEFPDHLLTREVFGSIQGMNNALKGLGVAGGI